jgi:predicted amidohydrolase YtcJ
MRRSRDAGVGREEFPRSTSVDAFVRVALVLGLWALSAHAAQAESPDLILHHGHIVTVDANFRIAEAIAVRGERIAAVGANDEVLALAGPETRRIDLAGKTVLPGLIDSHVHPLSAAMYEFDHRIPEMQSVADVLAYVRSRAAALGEGKLDDAAPRNPVIFRTGPDCSVNSLALKRSGIDKNFRIPDGGPGAVLRDPATGEPTGILRNGIRFVRFQPSGGVPTDEDRRRRLQDLLAAYNRAGITSICDRDAGDAAIDVYRRLRESGGLTCRVFLNYSVNAQGTWEAPRGTPCTATTTTCGSAALKRISTAAC